VKKLPVLAFGGLAVATVAAFFIIQHLKVTTPLIAGNPAPFPTLINPLTGGTCVVRTPDGASAPVSFSRTSVSFFLLHRSDNVDVYVVNNSGRIVATLASGVFMPGLPNQVTKTFTWTGRVYGGRLAPAGRYYMKVVLRRQGRTIDITNSNGALEWVRVTFSSRCPGA
jgi:flagellar hook assembly protein FlgD